MISRLILDYILCLNRLIFSINYDMLIKLYAIDSEKYFSKSAKKHRGGKNHPLCDRMRIYLRLFLLAIITRRRKVRNVLSAATT